ncbi:MAG TPA: DUF1761 domain-containing protein [Candidatus Bilamarchaeaceae archaeon]|nr:DUF1761 domain-containing protein [Candidatus Bilamarchaeaceae archaeon]
MVVVDVNVVAVVAAAVVSVVLGILWYGPLFGGQWMRLMSFRKPDLEKAKNKSMASSYIGGFIVALIVAYVLAHFVDYIEATTLSDGAMAGAWIWFGFVATLMFGGVLWERKPLQLYFLNALYHLLSLAAMGALLAIWV